MTKARDIASAIPAPSTVSSTELGYLDGVTSAIQTQIDTKAPSSTAVTLTGTQTLTNKTLTNPVIASVVNNTLTSTTGDMIYASAANTPARLGIGSSAQVLTVASGVPSWATPSSGGMTLISTTTLSGATTDLSSIPQTYNKLYLVIRGMTGNTSDKQFLMQPNADTSGVIHTQYLFADVASQIAGGGSVILSGNTETNRTSADNAWSVTIDNYTSATSFKPLQYYGRFLNSGFTIRAVMGAGTYSSNTAITSIRFTYQGTNTFSGGTVLLYGVK